MVEKYWVMEKGGERGIKFCEKLISAVREAKKHSFAEIWRFDNKLKAYVIYRRYSHGKKIWEREKNSVVMQNGVARV